MDNKDQLSSDLLVSGKANQRLKDRQHIAGVFLDLFKAFDYVENETLLDKLNSQGLQGILHQWIKSFYVTEAKL